MASTLVFSMVRMWDCMSVLEWAIWLDVRWVHSMVWMWECMLVLEWGVCLGRRLDVRWVHLLLVSSLASVKDLMLDEPWAAG